MDNHSRRMAHGDPRPIITRAAIVFLQGFLNEAAVQHSTYVTDFCRVGPRVVYLFSLWFLVRLLLFHCIPAGRHSDSTPDSRRVRLCSRLPCGSYGAGSPTVVVCSRESVGCGNGGNLRVCCS